MDKEIRKLPNTSINPPLQILSLSEVSSQELTVTPFLRDQKSIKLMAKQDRLALSAAATAVKEAGLTSEELNSETGIYLTVGTLPFEETHLLTLAENSVANGHFDMKRFSTEGYNAMNPILTFKCLPNMPIFHISYNLGIHGPYFITYPGPSQFFSAFEQAITDLKVGRIRFALIGAIADQENFLVKHHVLRSGVRDEKLLKDVGAVMVVTLENKYSSKARITNFIQKYTPVDPFSLNYPKPFLHFKNSVGPAEPLLVIKEAVKRPKSRLEFCYEDGIEASFEMEGQ